jgi:tricarboxylate carrier
MEGREPDFTLTGNRYDQKSYYGRFMKMLNICDPTMLLYSRSDINEAVEKLDIFSKLGEKSGISNKDLWHYRKLKESAVHPDTGEIIPLPFRMSGYVPFNGPVSVGLILSQRTPWILFWQWMNQSQNALVNYFNRNATSTVTDTVLAASYTGAVTSAMTIGYGLSQLVKRSFTPERATSFLKFIALPTSMVASSVNCLIMRWPETSTGITVYSDDTGEEIGKSTVAAKKAIKETVFSRMLLQLPVFVFPPMMTFLPPIASIMRKNPRLTTPITSVFLFIGFGLGLPASIAAFPQEGYLEESEVEPQLRGWGRLKYNKGL